jgi:hypothetical protein
MRRRPPAVVSSTYLNEKVYSVLRKVFLLSVLTLLSTSFGLAQTAQVSGFVSDPSGQNVVGARVTMTDEAKQVELNAVRNGSGLYAFTLPASHYQMVVRAAGFQTETKDDVVITVAQNTKINFSSTCWTGTARGDCVGK